MGNPHWRIDSGGMDDQNYGAITFMYVCIHIEDAYVSIYSVARFRDLF